MKRTPLRRVSKKRAKENREYSKLRRAFLVEMPWCQICFGTLCTIPATDVHHKDGREGSLLNRKDLWMALCRPCHDWIHQAPNKARKEGWLV